MPNVALLAIFVLSQLARLWIIASLGPYWTTRVITLPGAPLVREGPYAFMRHPNYAIVCIEIAILPLAFGAWQIALFFTVANAALLAWRIRAEDAALDPRR
jgi:methyltransferase